MKKQILTVVVVFTVFVGGLLLGRYMERKSQSAICAVRLAEAQQRERSLCEAQSEHLTEAFVSLQKRCARQAGLPNPLP